MSVSLPTLPSLAVCKPRLLDFGAMLTPALGGASQYVARLGSRYAVDVQLPTLKGATARKWIARRLKAKAQALTLTLAWPQPAFTTAIGAPVVNGGTAAGTTLPIHDLTPGATISEGTFFSFVANGRHYLHCVTDDVTADGTGAASLSIAPMLRVSPADGAALEFGAPVIEGFLDGNTVEWDLQRFEWVGVSFTLAENE